MAKRTAVAAGQTSLAFESDCISDLVASLPTLPPIIRYNDEFDGTVRTIREPATSRCIELVVTGTTQSFDFSALSPDHGRLLRHMLQFLIDEDLSISTVAGYIREALRVPCTDLVTLVDAGPFEIQEVWAVLRAREYTLGTYCFMKALLRLLCWARLQGWSDTYATFLHTSLPLPSNERHANVLSGDAILSAEEEAAIVRYLDEIALAAATERSRPPTAVLRDAAILLCSYQFAMRRVQIAMLRLANVRIWTDQHDPTPAVHLTFHMAKQRSDHTRHPLTRRVKREWSPIIVALHAARVVPNKSPDTRFFDVDSAHQVGQALICVLRNILGPESRRTASDLRHSAAQRLVDAGANAEELAEFMGHSSTSTGTVYFDVAASHAERVNRALGASDVYRKLAEIAHDRFIDLQELSELKEDQQIAGVPHGAPISGIGGCGAGQSLCPFNPIVSCYGCRKFMPLNDIQIHKLVLSELRGVVGQFERNARGDEHSPAYLQLQRTIADVSRVIDEILPTAS